MTVGGDLVVNETLPPRGTLTGTYLLRDGSPGVGVSVAVYTSAGEPAINPYTDETGSFRVDLLPGQYIVEFRRGSGQPEFWPRATLAAQARRLTITPNRTVSISMVALPTGTVTGVLTRPDGQPATYVEVTLTNTRTGFQQYATTDLFGTWRADDVLTGTYRIRFVHQQKQMQWAYGRTSARTANRIVVGTDRTTVVEDTLLPTGSLTVVAYDGPTGGPAQGPYCATIRMDGLVLGSWCQWDEDPAGITFNGLGPGTYEVSVATVGKPAVTTATVQSGQSTTVRVAVG